MSRTARFLGGLGFGYLHLVAVTLVGLWLTPFLLRHIGQHDLGLWLIITQIVSFLGLLDLGVVTLLPRETAYVAGTRPAGERPQLAPLLARVWRIVLLQVPVVVLAAIVAWRWVPTDWTTGRAPLLLVIVAFVSLFPARVFNALLQGVQDLAFVGRVQLLTWAVSTVITVGLVLAGVGLYAVVLGWVFAQAASAAASALRARRLVPEAFRWTRLASGDREVAAYLRRSAWIGVSQIAQVFLAGTDMLVIGRLLGPAAVVPYSCTTKLVTVLANHPHLLMHAASPALSEMRAGGSRERLAELSAALTIAMLVASGAIASVILAGNQLFVGWWVGAGQFGGWRLTVAAVLMMLLRHWNTASTYTLFCFGHDRRISLTMLGDGIVTLGGTLLLVPALGVIGAPLASILGVACVGLPWNLRQIGRDLDVTVWRVVLRLAPWGLRMGVASAVGGLLAWELAGTGFLGLVGGAALSGAVYAALMMPIVLRPPLRGFFLPAVETARRAVSGWRLRSVGTPTPRESQAE
jgi:O-antigen/teichoic acid export membrane protein